MISRPTGWMTGTPRLPPPAFEPSAHPLRDSGKKVLILVMDEAKLPPSAPATAAVTRKVVKDIPSCMMIAAKMVGISWSAALMIVQFRPPKRATANEYGSLRTEPTSVGTPTRMNFPAARCRTPGP
jgi:hypothetical protein